MGFKSWQWLYSEAGHGKGAPDGVGAAIKRQADAHVARGGVVKKPVTYWIFFPLVDPRLVF